MNFFLNYSLCSLKSIYYLEYAQLHNIRDIDNRVIFGMREARFILDRVLPDNLKFVINFVPGFVKIPQFVLDVMNSKF